MINAVQAVYRLQGRNFHRLNNALITLIPKKAEALLPKDSRPICLIHSFAKLVYKLLETSLARHLHQLVDLNQSAFIKGMSIQDNFKYVRYSAKLCQQRKKAWMLLKLDISKAFDSVS